MKKNLSLISFKHILYIFIILIILLLLFLINRINIKNIKNKPKYLENFQTKWTVDKDILKSELQSLNDIQKTEIKNMINSISQNKLKDLLTSQSPLLVGPEGPPGPQGPSGSTYIATGRLINKNGSFEKHDDKNNYFIPQYVVSRTEGNNSNSSLSFMDNVNPFGSYQNWELDINNHLKNRYDNSCLTINKNNNKIYMDKCDDNNVDQKWLWDNKTNRIISTELSKHNKLKCIGLSTPETNIITTNVPGCKEKNCINKKSRKYLELKECDINFIKDDEIWTFI
jgi:hypothetical protein